MICVSVARPTLRGCLAAVKGLEMAEIRIDRTRLSPAEIRRLFAAPATLVATCRPGTRTDAERTAALLAAIDAGAAFVDIESDAPAALRKTILAAARQARCRVVVSHHDFDRTPPRDRLLRLVAACFDRGADVAKICCRVRDARECARMLSLYGTRRNLIALGLGELGVVTRVAALFLGAPWTYASLAPGEETGEGQLDLRTLGSVLKLIQHG